jgi:hypothetical protein
MTTEPDRQRHNDLAGVFDQDNTAGAEPELPSGALGNAGPGRPEPASVWSIPVEDGPPIEVPLADTSFSWLPPGVTVIPVAAAPSPPRHLEPPIPAESRIPVESPSPVELPIPVEPWRDVEPPSTVSPPIPWLDVEPVPVPSGVNPPLSSAVPRPDPLTRRSPPLAPPPYTYPDLTRPLVRPVPGRGGLARRAAGRVSFRGRTRLADRIGFWRRLRSIIELVVVTFVLGALLATVVAAVIGAIVVALQNALG